MSDDVATKPEVLRDRDLEAKMLAAVIADRNDQPRNKQVAVGPSSIGFCRELLRAQLFEGVNNGLGQEIAGETHWAAAAHVGTVMGADLERIFGERLDAVTQQRVTTLFDMLGVSISGAMDLVFVEDDQVTDLKSTTDIGGVLYDLQKNAELIETLLNIWREDKLFQWYVETPDGGYELTDKLVNSFSKLQYWVQIAIYVVGGIQSGLLDPEMAEGRLVFYDRAGEFQEFVAVVVTSEQIEMFYDIGQARVGQVVQAQELLERTGNAHLVHQLRDQSPSFCFSPKVMCPMRDACWGGSEWESAKILDSADVSSSLDRYIEGRRLEKLGKGMKDGARGELKSIEGSTIDGRSVSWPGGRINVIETGRGAATRKKRSAADVAQEAIEKHAIEKPSEPMPERSEVPAGGAYTTGLSLEAASPESESAPTSQTVPPAGHVHRTKPGTKACSEGRCNPATIVQSEPDSTVESLEQREQSEWPDHEGRDGNRPSYPPGMMSGELVSPQRDPRIDAVQFVDTDPRSLEEAPADPPAARKAPRKPTKKERDKQAARDKAIENMLGPGMAVPPEVILEKHRDELTPAQVAFLERKAAEMQTSEEARARAVPLSGDELKAALEADTDAGKLRKMQQQQEASGQIARNRKAARFTRGE